MEQKQFCHYRSGVTQRVGRGIALLLHDRGTRRGWVFSSTPRPHFTPGKDPVPIVQEAGWIPGLVWTGAEKSRPHRGSIPELQSVVSRYIDWATRHTVGIKENLICRSCSMHVWVWYRYKILIGNFQENGCLGTRKVIWRDDIKTYHKKCVYELYLASSE